MKSLDRGMFQPYAREKLINDETKGKPTWSPEEKFIEEMEKVREVITKRYERGELAGSALEKAARVVRDYLKKRNPKIRIENLSLAEIDKVKYEEEIVEIASLYSSKMLKIMMEEFLDRDPKKLH